MDRRPQLMWEHEGQCQCGKKTYLAGQCGKCASGDAAERHDHVERQAAQDADAAVGDYELVVPPPGSLAKEIAASELDDVAAWLETHEGHLIPHFAAPTHEVQLASGLRPPRLVPLQ